MHSVFHNICMNFFKIPLWKDTHFFFRGFILHDYEGYKKCHNLGPERKNYCCVFSLNSIV